MHRVPSLLVPIALVIALPMLAGCREPASAPSPAPPASECAPPSASFAWIPVRPASEASPEEYPARLLRTSTSEAVVVPPLPARLVSLAVRPGDTVSQGDPIARVVMPEIDVALATLTGAESALAILRRRRAQLVPLERERLVQASEVAAVDLEIARHSADRLRASAVITGAGISRGGTIVLRSPIAGVVTEVPATLGELRRPEDGPIARVRSRVGQRIEATFPARPTEGATYSFRSAAGAVPIALVNQVPAPTGLGYLAWFEAPAGAEMPAAAEGRVLVHSPAGEGSWLVPATAVGARGTGRFVVARTRSGAGAALVAVELVRVANADAIVRAALPEGALVASDPARGEGLVDGGARR